MYSKENSYQPERFQLHIFPWANLNIFFIFFGHNVKAFVTFPVTVAMVTLIWSPLKYHLCICITDIDSVNYVENYSHFVLLEGGSLH